MAKTTRPSTSRLPTFSSRTSSLCGGMRGSRAAYFTSPAWPRTAATNQLTLAQTRDLNEQRRRWSERKPLVFTFAKGGGLWIVNVGGGPALNVFYLNPDIDPRPMGLGALGAGQERQLLPTSRCTMTHSGLLTRSWRGIVTDCGVDSAEGSLFRRRCDRF